MCRPDDLATFVAAIFRHDVVTAALADPDQRYLVAAVAGADVGYALLRHEPEGAARDGGALELGLLYVDQAYQGRGVGAALMSECIAHTRRHRYRTLRLTVWEHNARGHQLLPPLGLLHDR